LIYPLFVAGYWLGPAAWAWLLQPLDWLDLDHLVSAATRPAETNPLGATAELVAQCLGGGIVASVMRAPIGCAVLFGAASHAQGTLYAMMVVVNLVAVSANPLSPLGQVDD